MSEFQTSNPDTLRIILSALLTFQLELDVGTHREIVVNDLIGDIEGILGEGV